MRKQEFVKLAREKYGDSFDYQHIPEHIKRVQERIICKEHGDIWVIPRDHLRTKYGCPHCALENRTNTNFEYNQKMIAKAKEKHKGKFDYTEVDFSLGPNDKVVIKCPVHGKVKMRLRTHYLSIGGCTKCGEKLNLVNRTKYKDLKKDIIPIARKVHGERYQYLDYDNETKMLTFKCPDHGIIEQYIYSHFSGRGCRSCGYALRTITPDEFLERAKKTHPEGYEYELSELNTVNDKITIKHSCGKEYQGRVSNHLSGQGCSRCSSSLGEAKTRLFLELRGIRYKDQYKVEGYPFKYDFYLPDLKILIEYDGEQHFRPIEYFGGEKTFKLQQRLDKKKDNIAEEEGLYLIRIPFTEYSNLEEFLSRAIDKLFKYCINRILYRNIDELYGSFSWVKNHSEEALNEHRTFEVLKSLPGPQGPGNPPLIAGTP